MKNLRYCLFKDSSHFFFIMRDYFVVYLCWICLGIALLLLQAFGSFLETKKLLCLRYSSMSAQADPMLSQFCRTKYASSFGGLDTAAVVDQWLARLVTIRQTIYHGLLWAASADSFRQQWSSALVVFVLLAKFYKIFWHSPMMSQSILACGAVSRELASLIDAPARRFCECIQKRQNKL